MKKYSNGMIHTVVGALGKANAGSEIESDGELGRGDSDPDGWCWSQGKQMDLTNILTLVFVEFSDGLDEG